ncbi:hypothetical protein CMI37_23390 [Candidatus Pacearchaeota archaeon]|nr:hypothetical protein [Candidatus Pacearchaeota archaeon]|tara:strand:+ start:575 stop:2323 length:1749 start_codon:yes stop_codon:yes gene_type:complete
MRISGYKKRRISTFDSSTPIAFDLDIEVTSTTGEATFGLSGTVDMHQKTSSFTFKSGRIFDPEGRNVFSYSANQNINLKGTFLQKTYDYFINNDLICSIGKKDAFKINSFFFDSDGCEIEINDLNVYGPQGTLDVSNSLLAKVFSADGIAGEAGSANAVLGSSSVGSTLTFKDALTFNKNTSLIGSILSGEVTDGHQFFEFDNSASNISYLSDVAGGGTKKDLKLISQTELAERGYPLGFTFYTTFGNFKAGAFLLAGSPENPSGVMINIGGEGYPLNEDETIVRRHSLQSSAGEAVSGSFFVSYLSDLAVGDDATLGLPYKIYLEHVDGDHSKKYSFLTGVQLSGSGLYYDTEDINKKIRFRSGELGAAAASATDGATLGLSINDEASGLVSRENSTYKTMMTEAHISSIRTNLYSGDTVSATPNLNFNIQKMKDGHLLVQFPNTGIADVVTMIDPPDDLTNYSPFQLSLNKPSGIAKVFSYTKPVTDWKVFTGDPFMVTDSYVEHTQTGIDSTPLRRHKYVAGQNEYFLKVVVQAKNYVDSDPMSYKLHISGADGFKAESLIKATVMETGYDIPLSPKLF